ncbi:WSC-domain-containing protein [Parathielavia hyrcaniae]|uniref:WSC-domain-containing protein n=1 Tax=Parathielavia hyrcaniae TaxID=113614 RepID=A0AAN6PWP0_9PEZI|nr:WSC-domain-containing protein [Parathielavia hyrcaniae]
MLSGVVHLKPRPSTVVEWCGKLGGEGGSLTSGISSGSLPTLDVVILPSHLIINPDSDSQDALDFPRNIPHPLSTMQTVLALAAIVPAALAQTYYGCYTEVPARALTGSSTIDYTTMTIGDCETYCTGLSFSLWGLEYGGECYCGDSLAQGSFPAFSTDCTMACAGDATEVCGGPNRLSLYGVSVDAPTVTPYPTPEPVEGPPVYEGCWTELPGPRALDGASAFSASDMTVDGCANYCLNNGFPWFGLEYSAECYCGTELNVNSTLALDEDCNMACTGDSSEVCGGSNRLSVWQWPAAV